MNHMRDRHGITLNFLAQFLQAYQSVPSLALWRAVEAEALAHITFEPPVLDLACGTGHFTKILLGDRVAAGCDLNEGAVRIAAREKVFETVSVADARDLPYPDRSFRTVISNCAIEHIPDAAQAFGEVVRVLKPRGSFVFTVPSEHFNDCLLLPRLYRFLGLPSRASTHVKWYSLLQNHHNVDPLSLWKKRLEKEGLRVLRHRYYMHPNATLVFSIWDLLAKWTVRVPGQGYQIAVQERLLLCLPRRLCVWILYYSLVRFYRASLNTNCGCGLLIVARKEEDLP